jgi:L-cystine uptake protein TcyP (sodium:dicarboxylate symporter family)
MFTLENVHVLFGLIVFVALLAGLTLLQRKAVGFSVRTLTALAVGTAYGICLQLLFGAETASGTGAIIKGWINIPGSIFTKTIQLVIVPLVFVSIVRAIGNFSQSNQGVKKAGKIIGFLLVTTAASAIISIIVTRVFNLSVDNLIQYDASTYKPANIAATILNLIPNNLFAAFSSNSVLPIVFVAALIGFAIVSVKHEAPHLVPGTLLETAYALVMKVVDMIIQFTPYGVLSIIAVRAASGNGAFIIQLAMVIAVCFVALALVFIMHLVLAALHGVNPVIYLKQSVPALIFAFSSRSSAATVPLTIKAQRNLGVGEANANLAATLGTCIGQNGCAGVYPTMLAILVGLVQGWNVWSLSFLIPLIIYIVIASIGTAGVGGGATNVSLMVLSLLGLPVELVAILISVDFIIDMGRTLVNVSDSILAGYVVSVWEGEVDTARLHGKVPASATVTTP